MFEDARRELANSVAPHALVDAHEVRPEHLGQPPVDVAPREVHLKEPVAGHRVAFGDEQVVHGAGPNVRHAALVARDRHRPVHGHLTDGPVDACNGEVPGHPHARGIEAD